MLTPTATRRGIRPMKDMISVVLTIDTEPDDAWTNHLNSSVANVQELRRLQELLDLFGAKATCLVTYRVIKDGRAVDVLNRLVDEGAAEIGAHLHPWETPPFMDSGIDVKHHTYPHELPLDAFKQKLEALTEAIAGRFGLPTSYRAGRWGLAAEHLAVLENLGYIVDTSVIPLVDWRRNPGIPLSENGHGGIDYRFAPQRPYHPAYTDVTREGDARIVELPVTVSFTRRTPTFVRTQYGAWPKLLRRALRKTGILRPVWAVPPEESMSRLERLIDVELDRGVPLINIAFHSSELMPGGSPATRTREAADVVFRRIASMLERLASRDECVFETLTEAARRYADKKM